MAEGEVVAAGGYIVQLLPEVGEGPLMVMTERLNDFAPMSRILAQNGAADPRALLSELLYGMPYTDLAEAEIKFGCNCSEQRVLSGIATLPRRDVKDLYDKGEVLEIACDFCRREYRVRPEQLRGLLGESN
jgi:molecular chaperone Hsp33